MLATVTPQVQTANFVTKSIRKTSNSNTYTTTTVSTPKTTPNSSLPAHLVSEGFTTLEEKEIKDKNVLENLSQMLKLLTSLPGSLQTPIVNLVADEMLKQLKTEKNGFRPKESESQKTSHVTPLSSDILGNQKQQRIPRNKKEIIDYQTSECYSPENEEAVRTDPPVKLYPVVKHPTTDQFTLCTSSQETFLATRVTDSRPANFQTMPEISLQTSAGPIMTVCDSSKLVYPKEPKVELSTVSPTKLGVVRSVCKKSPVPVTLGATTGPSQLTNGTTFNNVYSQYFTLKKEKTNNGIGEANPKLEYFTTQTPTRTLVANPILSVSTMGQSSSVTQTLLDNGFKMPVPTPPTKSPPQQFKDDSVSGVPKATIAMHRAPKLSTLSHEKEESSSSSPLPSMIFPYGLNELNSGLNIDNAVLALHVENCDPLLSQVNGVSTPMPLAPSSDQSSLNDHSTIVQCPSSTIVSSAAPEVSIAQLSENDLLNYINPTCFDNG